MNFFAGLKRIRNSFGKKASAVQFFEVVYRDYDLLVDIIAKYIRPLIANLADKNFN